VRDKALAIAVKLGSTNLKLSIALNSLLTQNISVFEICFSAMILKTLSF